MTFGLDAQIIDRLVGDRGGHDLAASDVDADVRGGGALLDFDDGALDLVACTDPHGGPHGVALAYGVAARLLVQDEKPGPPSQNAPRAYGARISDISAFSGRRKSPGAASGSALHFSVQFGFG